MIPQVFQVRTSLCEGDSAGDVRPDHAGTKNAVAPRMIDNVSRPSVASEPSAAPERWRPLTGGTAVWLFMCVEVVSFGLLLLGHAHGWRGEGDVYREAQALLHVDSGVRGTAVLLVGSGLAYQAVLSNAAGRPRATAGWLVASAVAGLAFSANKILEYASPELAGVTLSTNGFWFSYLFITALHLLHVLGGIGILFYLAVQAARGVYGPDNTLNIEAGAAYWHLVDVTWILVFPILYLMHP